MESVESSSSHEEDSKRDITAKDIDNFVQNITVSDKKDIKSKLHAILNNSCDTASFSHAEIGTDGANIIASCLEQNATLTELNLTGNNIDETGAKLLGKALGLNQTLKTISLSDNRIGDAGAKALGDGLKQNKSLVSLVLNKCLLRDDGVIGLAEGLKINDTLTSLELQVNLIDEDGAKAISDVLIHNNTLTSLSLDYLPVSGLLTIANACKIRTRLQNLHFHPSGRQLAEQCLEVGEEEEPWEDLPRPRIIRMVSALSFDNTPRIKGLIGKGNYGSAYRARYDGQDCVLKYAHDDTSGEAIYESLLLSCLPEHENVLRLIGKNDNFEIDGKRRSVLMVEAHNGGALKNYVRTQKGKIGLKQQLSYCHQMTSAIQHLHQYNMLHRDIALRNFVLTDDLQGVVVIDFGLSYVVEESTEPFYMRDGEEVPLKRLAPESLCSPYPYFLSSDIWMLGLAFWELQTGEEPFTFSGRGLKLHRSYLLKKMLKNPPTSIPLAYPPKFPPQLKELTEFCCQFDFLKRPTAKDVVEKIREISENLNSDEAKIENNGETDAVTSTSNHSAQLEDNLGTYVDVDYDLAETQDLHADGASGSRMPDSAEDLLAAYVGIGDYDTDGYEGYVECDYDGPDGENVEVENYVQDAQKQLKQYYYDVAGLNYWSNE